VHGAALGEKEVAAVREYIGWTHAPFEIPPTSTPPGTPKPPAPSRSRLERQVRRLRAQFPAEAAELSAAWLANCRPPSTPRWPPASPRVEKKENIATRKASQNAIQALAPCCRNSWAARPT
jgi:transketolase